MQKTTADSCVDVDAVMFILDAHEGISDTDRKLLEKYSALSVPTVLVLTKTDIMPESLLISENYNRMLLTVKLPPESAESSRFVEALNAKVDEVFDKNAYVAGEIPTTYDLIKAFDGDRLFINVFTVVAIFLIVLVVFKSLSLPVLLVTVIQGAVWIAMSFTLIGGGSMFFMSYIMSMCILMGATIDYGILLSTNYVKYRSTMDKREALEAAIDSAMPTIFNSGLILMICGFIVGLVASQTSISSVGFLLFRGTLISVIMITIVLPSLLYLLDKLVLKLTYRKNLNK
jgi:predicted RND superfamily exporter protein